MTKLIYCLLLFVFIGCKEDKDVPKSVSGLSDRVQIKTFDPETYTWRQTKNSWSMTMYSKDSFSFGTAGAAEKMIGYREAKRIADSLCTDYINRTIKIPL